MKMIECIHTQCNGYGVGRASMTPVGIVVHSTGVNNPNLRRYVQPSEDDPKKAELLSVLGKNNNGNSWNRRNVYKSMHYFIGKTAKGEVAVAHILPENIAAWGVGKGNKGSYNYDPVGHIQFEVCEDNLKDESYFDEIYAAATELCADICYRYGWEADVIVSHKEAAAEGYASSHGDIDHWLLKHGLSMDDFRDDVDELLDEMRKESETVIEEEPSNIRYRVQVGSYAKKEKAEAMAEKLEAEGYDTYIVETENPDEGKSETSANVTAEPQKEILSEGDRVKVKAGATNYTWKSLASFVYERVHEIKEIAGDRAVITYNGVIAAAVNVKDLYKA